MPRYHEMKAEECSTLPQAAFSWGIRPESRVAETETGREGRVRSPAFSTRSIYLFTIAENPASLHVAIVWVGYRKYGSEKRDQNHLSLVTQASFNLVVLARVLASSCSSALLACVYHRVHSRRCIVSKTALLHFRTIGIQPLLSSHGKATGDWQF